MSSAARSAYRSPTIAAKRSITCVAGMAALSTLPARGRRAVQPVIDGLPQPVFRDGLDRYHRSAAAVEHLEMGIKIGRRLAHVTFLRKVQNSHRMLRPFNAPGSEGKQRLALA